MSEFIRDSFSVSKRLVRKVVAPSTLLAHISKYVTISDELYLSVRYYLTFGRRLDFSNPTTFTAKIQWLKRYGHPELYASLADKFAVRDYVSATIGSEYLNRMIAVYRTADEIDWDGLPESFVLKASHASGWNLIVRDKKSISRDAAITQCKKWLTAKYTDYQRESVYKGIEPRIICVEYLGDPDVDLHDYKLYCFNGEVKMIHVDTGRFTSHRRTFYSPDWDLLPFTYTYPGGETVARPEGLEKMITLAETLAGSIPFVRVDFFHTRDQIVFCEMTFYPDGGFGAFSPGEWDTTVGNYLALPAYSMTPDYQRGVPVHH